MMSELQVRSQGVANRLLEAANGFLGQLESLGSRCREGDLDYDVLADLHGEVRQAMCRMILAVTGEAERFEDFGDARWTWADHPPVQFVTDFGKTFGVEWTGITPDGGDPRPMLTLL